jgi:hypothetical protein
VDFFFYREVDIFRKDVTQGYRLRFSDFVTACKHEVRLYDVKKRESYEVVIARPITWHVSTTHITS